MLNGLSCTDMGAMQAVVMLCVVMQLVMQHQPTLLMERISTALVAGVIADTGATIKGVGRKHRPLMQNVGRLTL